MEPITITAILTATLGYIFKAVGDTKLVKDAENSALTKFWSWIKPKVVPSVPEIEIHSDDEATINKTQDQLLKLIRDEDFFEQLICHIDDLKKAGVTEKNIVKANLKNIRVVHIGDKTYTPNDTYARKNYFEGSAEGIDEFRVGDD
jgi:hypothetical protein